MKTYTFRSSNGLVVTMLRGEDAPKMTGGGGGWIIEPRPRRVGMTVWEGREPYKMEVPVLFDGFADDRSVESSIAKLNQMQMGRDLIQPPTVTIEGSVPVKGIKWVIENIEWGDNVYWDGEIRTRQDAVVALIQYVPETRVKINRDPRTRATVYTVKKGDTLRIIAKRPTVYGDAEKWKLIATANNLRIPGNKKLDGMNIKTLRIP